jgi:hypothetical protein
MFFSPERRILRKLRKCYPTKPGNDEYDRTQLNKLAYYISSKPQRMAFVMSHLHKRIITDFEAQRSVYADITLRIVSELLDRFQVNLIREMALPIIVSAMEYCYQFIPKAIDMVYH